MGLIVGIDIGGSTTKIVGVDGDTLINCGMVKASDPLTSAYGAFGKFLNENNLKIENVDKVMCTGVGSSFLKDGLYGIETQTVDEFMANGLGGRYVSGCDNAIVVSMGTGTAFISVEGESIEHICGTGIGGGTILGLSQRLFNMRDFETIIALASNGDLAKVDLTIGDIFNSKKLANMELKTTASNFGRISDTANSADLALGVLNLVFQTIGIFAAMAARMHGLDKIVLTGNLSKIPFARSVMDDLEALHNVKYVIPPRSDFATAIGAALFGK